MQQEGEIDAVGGNEERIIFSTDFIGPVLRAYNGAEMKRTTALNDGLSSNDDAKVGSLRNVLNGYSISETVGAEGNITRNGAGFTPNNKYIRLIISQVGSKPCARLATFPVFRCPICAMLL